VQTKTKIAIVSKLFLSSFLLTPNLMLKES